MTAPLTSAGERALIDMAGADWFSPDTTRNMVRGIKAAQAELTRLDAAPGPLSDADDRRWAMLEQRIGDLRDRCRAHVEALTGVPADELMEVL